MAAFFKIAVLLTVNLIFVTADDCKCSDKVSTEELKELWDFLSTDGNSDNAVIPGELTELVPCRNCIEQNRRKRRIEQGVIDEFKREERSPMYTRRVWRHEDNQRNKCPIGYRKLFWRCIKF